MEQESLPSFFEDLATRYFIPVAAQVAAWRTEMNRQPLILGINGAQGTGKSTLSLVLAKALEHQHHLTSAVLSIDDIYHTHEHRAELAKSIHPLLATRGVPGTHDIELGLSVIKSIKDGHFPATLPSFDKVTDDRKPVEYWQQLDQSVDVLIFEGWCVGAQAEPPAQLASPVNTLEQKEDQHTQWRTFVNQQLQQDYTELFSLIDKLVMLKAPDFECVYHWRGQQEQKLRQRIKKADPPSKIMTDQQLARFIMHYERLTRWMFSEMPGRADIIIELNQNHQVKRTAGL
ncbi:MAG: hypothetical protein KJO21_05515 [Verrucomicrobiae bacterium]|nr:hypothetical protein [Verrucomicrobiae bacterium]NNJ43180.1 hypothetical protein [Akkermansiaceae bacterium]